MTLTLQAASARQHPKVYIDNVRKVLWLVAERPLIDLHGRRFYRVIVDAEGSLCWPRWRIAFWDTVELLSPERYPTCTLVMPDDSRALPRRVVCAKCGRTFSRPGGRGIHEKICGWWGRVAA